MKDDSSISASLGHRPETYRPLSVGERMIWAAEFVRSLHEHGSAHSAAGSAGDAVYAMRRDIAHKLCAYDVAMLADMLGNETP